MRAKRPNLFTYATSELSQDALIAWLLEWGSPEHEEQDACLHRCGQNLIRALFELHGKTCPAKIAKIEIKKQTKNIDVLCVINGEYAIIIEDKRGTKEHSGQLAKYLQDVLGRSFSTEKTVPIYFQTHEQSSYADVKAAGYEVFSREAILPLLRACESRNDILMDFRDKLEELDALFASYATIPIRDWGWHSWQGFYKALQAELQLVGECWGYTPNQSGGFLGFNWFWHLDGEPSCYVFLQLEQAKFCFKIGEVESEVRHQARGKWFTLISENCRHHNLEVDRPARFGNGRYMTVAVLRKEYRMVDENGLLDLGRTIANIRSIEAMMIALIAQHAKAPERSEVATAL